MTPARCLGMAFVAVGVLGAIFGLVAAFAALALPDAVHAPSATDLWLLFCLVYLSLADLGRRLVGWPR